MGVAVLDLQKLERINSLFDFYGLLLTPKQQLLMHLYYKEDLSLGEIAAEHAISRQAVHDTLQRAQRTLVQYEEKLGLLGKYGDEKEKAALALHKLGECKRILDDFSPEGDDGKSADQSILAAQRLVDEVALILEGILELNYS